MKYTFAVLLRTALGVYPYDIKHFDDINEAKKHFREYKAQNLSKFGLIIKSEVFIENEYEEYDLHQYDPRGNIIEQTAVIMIYENDGKETKDTMKKIDSSKLYSVYISKHVNSIVTSQLCHMSNITLKDAIQMRHVLFENFLNKIKNDDINYRFENSSESERHCSVIYTDRNTKYINSWTCFVIRQDQLRGVHPLGIVLC